MLIIFNILFPVISIILMGFIIGRARIFNEDFFAGVNKLVYRFGLAPLLFVKTSTMSVNLNEAIQSFGIMVTLISSLIFISWCISIVMKLPPKMKGAFIHVSMRGNFAYIGLPVIFYAFAGTAYESIATETAIMIFTPAILFQNVSAILIMIHNGEDRRGGGFIFIIRSLSKDPLIIACVSGLLLNGLGIDLPIAFIRTGESLGNMALPLALIGIGAVIDPGLLRGAIIPPIIASFIKTMISPIIMLIILNFLEINIHETQGRILLILAACSTAVSSYIITEQYGGDGKLAGSAVFISAVFSLFSLSIALTISN